MRACATVNAVCLGLSLVAAAFVACSNSPPPQPPTTDAVAPAASEESASAPASTPASAGASTKEPQTVADCKEILSEITNDPPDAGVVMNNAMTAGDAGSSDRFAPLVELIKQKRDGFRCCFDLWARKNPGAKGRVMMVFNLAPDGKLNKVFQKHEESGIHAPEVESCMVELAGTLTYPKSPSGKETEFSYPFDFKAK